MDDCFCFTTVTGFILCNYICLATFKCWEVNSWEKKFIQISQDLDLNLDFFSFQFLRKFKASRLSLNIKKTKYTFFHKNSVKDNIPLKPPELKIDNRAIARTHAIKFLGVLLDENDA